MKPEHATPQDGGPSFTTNVVQPIGVDPREYDVLRLADEEFAKYKVLSAGLSPDAQT